jgi:HPt (histidine-containing phosphotransfer) domain-containing protein
MASAAALEVGGDPVLQMKQAAEHGRPVDLVHLSRYTLGDSNLEREVLQLFQAQARIYLDRLEQAADPESWKQAAHTIKGSAKGIGAWAVAWSAENAEHLSGAPKCKDASDAVAGLRDAVTKTSGFIDELLAHH